MSKKFPSGATVSFKIGDEWVEIGKTNSIKLKNIKWVQEVKYTLWQKIKFEIMRWKLLNK